MADLDQQIEQARARLRDLQARASKQRRRDETRKKIIYGAAALRVLEDLTGEQQERYLQALHRKVFRPGDREWLGLDLAESTKQA